MSEKKAAAADRLYKDEKQQQQQADEIIKMRKMDDYLEQGMDKHTWDHSSLPRLSSFKNLRCED